MELLQSGINFLFIGSARWVWWVWIEWDAVQQNQEEGSWNVIVLENMLTIDREDHFHDTIPTPPTPNLDCKHHTKI